MLKNRFVVKIAGESGQGIDSSGQILMSALMHEGYSVFGYREYPSLIKGGWSCFQIDISNRSISSSSKYTDLLICLSRVSLHKYLGDLNPGGVLIHNIAGLDLNKEESQVVKQNGLQLIYIDTLSIIQKLQGTGILSNIVMLGVAWKVLGIPASDLEDEITEEFKDKPKLLEMDLKALNEGYHVAEALPILEIPFKKVPTKSSTLLFNGNEALAKGAIGAEVKAFYGYPMTPATSILTNLALWQKETGMTVRQVEDEITAIQMTIGSMFVGARAFTATSGGGFDLMTETVSLSGMTETPIVVVLGQRPGPATGLPTWTAQSDLNLAIYSGHGEYPKIVLAASDATTAHTLIQKAFNLAEKYQVPVILLTDKQIAESFFNIEFLPKNLKVNRSLISESALKKLAPTDRYKDTKSGVSPRWFPTDSHATFVGNSDEHIGDGSVTEDAVESKNMMEKRMRKLETLLKDKDFGEPEVYGADKADLSFIGWGSTKNTILDLMQYLKDTGNKTTINYLHFENIFPLQTKQLEKFLAINNNITLIEGNFTGQLGELITKKTGYMFSKKLLKYDGRPFFIEDILDYLHIKHE